ncbi:hypothetical protein BHM03_00009811 [Ensete ventricosum]|nr:hypothetical protein BHM03_00009811 [Ensete ventricosum]
MRNCGGKQKLEAEEKATEEGKRNLVFAESSRVADAIEELSAGGVLHHDRQMRGRQHDLQLKSREEKPDLLASGDVLHGDELSRPLVPHQPRHAEVARPDILHQLVLLHHLSRQGQTPRRRKKITSSSGAPKKRRRRKKKA